MYDEAGHLVGEYTISSGAAVRVQETVWLGDIPIATLRTNGAGVDVFYVHTDQLNTPTKVTSNAATPVLRWKWDPTPFGEGAPTEPAGAFKYNLRFPGQYFDVETNLNYNYFRDYDPATGRYAESDPIGLSGGINTYAYADSTPIEQIDEDGLQAVRPPIRLPRIGVPGGRSPLVPMPRPANLEPQWTIPSSNTSNSCNACFNVFWTVEVRGTSRGSHRDQGNRSFFDYVNGPSGPTNGNYISRDMIGPNGRLRNPTGFEWHHPRDRPGEIWLVARCQHRGDTWQGSIHPGGMGGFSQFRQSVGPPR